MAMWTLYSVALGGNCISGCDAMLNALHWWHREILSVPRAAIIYLHFPFPWWRGFFMSSFGVFILAWCLLFRTRPRKMLFSPNGMSFPAVSLWEFAYFGGRRGGQRKPVRNTSPLVNLGKAHTFEKNTHTHTDSRLTFSRCRGWFFLLPAS